MASVAENQALVNSLFAPAVNTFAQFNQAKLAIAQMEREERMRQEELRRQQALMNLRRQQEVADMTAQRAQQVALANIQRQTALDVEQGRMDRADQSAKLAADRDDARNSQQIKLRMLAAYSEYAQAAARAGEEPKPIETFGEGEEAVIKIAAAKSNVDAKVMESAATDLANERNTRLSNLRRFEQGQSKTDELNARAMALSALDEDDAERFEATRQAKGEAAALKLLKPEQRTNYQTGYMGALQNLRVQRLESPEYKALQTEVQSLDRLIQPLVTQNPSLTKLFRPKEVISEVAEKPLPSAADRAAALGANLNPAVPTNAQVRGMLQENQAPEYGLGYWLRGMSNPRQPGASAAIPVQTPEQSGQVLNQSLRRLSPAASVSAPVAQGISPAALQSLLRPQAPAITPVAPQLTITPVRPELTITPAPLANIYGPR